jgi:hypothetical protein
MPSIFFYYSPPHFLHKEADRRVVCSLGSLSFFLSRFSSFTAVLSIGQRHVARFPPFRAVKIKKERPKVVSTWAKFTCRTNCSTNKSASLLSLQHFKLFFSSLSFLKKNRFTLTLKSSFWSVSSASSGEFRTLKASVVLMMFWSSRRMNGVSGRWKQIEMNK